MAAAASSAVASSVTAIARVLAGTQNCEEELLGLLSYFLTAPRLYSEEGEEGVGRRPSLIEEGLAYSYFSGI